MVETLTSRNLKTREKFWRLSCSDKCLLWGDVLDACGVFVWGFSLGVLEWLSSLGTFTCVAHVYVCHVSKCLLTVTLAYNFKDTCYALVGLDVFIKCKMSCRVISPAWLTLVLEYLGWFEVLYPAFFHFGEELKGKSKCTCYYERYFFFYQVKSKHYKYWTAVWIHLCVVFFLSVAGARRNDSDRWVF